MDVRNRAPWPRYKKKSSAMTQCFTHQPTPLSTAPRVPIQPALMLEQFSNKQPEKELSRQDMQKWRQPNHFSRSRTTLLLLICLVDSTAHRPTLWMWLDAAKGEDSSNLFTCFPVACLMSYGADKTLFFTNSLSFLNLRSRPFRHFPSQCSYTGRSRVLTPNVGHQMTTQTSPVDHGAAISVQPW
ncbi:hypothetical protein BGZ60DRAFT_236860 [Tricladium varicosporioides]|nr:hypothetical protein BGZ60DRAFT_236860 [Hymenoscyphus varicosporioides]